MSIINIFKKGTRALYSGIDTYVVEWTSRWGEFHGNTNKNYQAFISKDEAESFAEELRRAHKLIGNTCTKETRVTVIKQNSGL